MTDSKSNRHIIYKFMMLGFGALTHEELACTLVNPTFTIDFKKNAKEDWTKNYHLKAIEKIKESKFPIEWFTNQCSASGFDDEHQEDDTEVLKDGVKVVVDGLSYQYLVGSTVDYSESLTGSQFVVENPNASSTCGCGASFSL